MFKRIFIVICAATVLLSGFFDIIKVFAIKGNRQIVIIDAGHGGLTNTIN